MNSIQAEHEAFEALQFPLIFERIVFIESANLYIAKDDFQDDLFTLTKCNELNFGWQMWQLSKAQAVPEAITIGNELQSWVAVWSFRAKNDGEDYVVVDANLLAEIIEKLTGANA